ncbi:LysR family transcriptional regulator [Cognatishimia maritima]|uniref:DNA-binding transcriptional regulator, LysR family n=1 Tax=Cognatishimia maritima TaxID=870908 RepID=A0A1M5QBU8_9RHOB|nr:LysR family transcriptional regulator [Cognatishimia maritima]SHH11346.1 DNA-binding transcriptional regulator, LysR family [Cognatishimia maritima]
MRLNRLQIHSQDLELIRVFTEVTRAGGISAAEARLKLDRSTISRHVKSLETRLGGTLCHRGRTGFALTELGRNVFYAGIKLEDSMEEVRCRLTSARSKFRGTLRIGVSDHCLTNPAARLIESIAKFQEAAPDVSLQIETAPPSSLLGKVADRDLHACVVGLPIEEAKFETMPLFSEYFVLCGAKSALADITSPEDLGQIGFGLAVRSEERAFEASVLEKLPIRSPIARARGLDSLALLLAAGRHVGLLPMHTLPHISGPDHELALVPRSERLTAERKFVFARLRSRAPSRSLEFLMKCMKEEHAIDQHQLGDQI